MYQLINNQLIENNNPILTKEGYITNPTEEILKKEGFKYLVDNIPVYDVATQYLSLTRHTEDENNIYTNYEVINIPQQEPSEIELLRRDLEVTQDALNELIMNSMEV